MRLSQVGNIISPLELVGTWDRYRIFLEKRVLCNKILLLIIVNEIFRITEIR
jgi:hypothetical protein